MSLLRHGLMRIKLLHHCTVSVLLLKDSWFNTDSADQRLHDEPGVFLYHPLKQQNISWTDSSRVDKKNSRFILQSLLMICWISVWFIILEDICSACSAGIWEQKKLNYTLYFLCLFSSCSECSTALWKYSQYQFIKLCSTNNYLEEFWRDLGLASWLQCVLAYS